MGSAATRARVADLVRQAVRHRAGGERAGGRRGRGRRRARLARLPRGPHRRSRRAGAARRSSCSASRCTRRWDPSLEAYATLCATHVAAALAEVRQLSEERRRRQDLVELDAAKSAFFTNLSHELRTPLTLISGPVQEALAVEDDPASGERLELVERSTHRLARMVDAMLDFGRIEAGRPRAAASRGRRVGARHRAWPRASVPAVERAGLAFSHDCGDGIRGVLDRDMVERIVLNLLANAVKYTPEGSVALTVRGVDDEVEIAVSDTGVGIHPDDVERAFARFERLPAADGARSHEGAGIGLAMVRAAHRADGGHGRRDQRGRARQHLHGPPPRRRTGRGRRPPGEVGCGRHPPAASTTSCARSRPGSGRGPDPRLPPAPCVRARASDGDGRPRVLVAEDNVDLRTYLGEVLADHYDVELVARRRRRRSRRCAASRPTSSSRTS